MTKNEILSELAKEKFIENTLKNISKGSFKNIDDLSQDLYLKLLEKDEDKIVDLYEKKQLNYFIVKMITTNLFSPRSDYAYDYKKWDDKRTDLSTIIDNEE